MVTEQSTLQSLEVSLMNACNVQEAEKIVNALDRNTLEDLYYHLKAFTRKKTVANIRKSIVECTYISYHRHLVITGKR